MRVLITGGAGLIGRAVATHLTARGWDVHLIDILPEVDIPDVTYAMCDIMDFNGLREQVRGCDAIVHMAALKNPFFGESQDVYHINTTGTFNLFEAAAREGIPRIVQASSINAIGCMWGITEFTPEYLPIDEKHRSITSDSYSFSKRQIEDIGEFFWQRDQISSIALRFPGVYKAEGYRSDRFYEHRRTMTSYINQFLELPGTERQRQLAEVRLACLAYRAERKLEFPEKMMRLTPPEGINEFLWRAYTFDRYNLWANMDERDAAQSVEKSLTADYEGSHALFVNDDHNTLDYDARTLAHIFFPEVSEDKLALSGSDAFVSINRARQLIGFEPQYSLHGNQHD
jgi:nucleoside-diphosphate-sugar epimerase